MAPNFPSSPVGGPPPVPETGFAQRDPFETVGSHAKPTRNASRWILRVVLVGALSLATFAFALYLSMESGDERGMIATHDHSDTEYEIPVDGKSNVADGVAFVTYSPIRGDAESVETTGRLVMADGYVSGHAWSINHWDYDWRSSVSVLYARWEQDLSDPKQLKRWVYRLPSMHVFDTSERVKYRKVKFAGASAYETSFMDKRNRHYRGILVPRGRHHAIGFSCLIAPSNPPAMLERCDEMASSIDLTRAR
jgi:hypothetical protein